MPSSSHHAVSFAPAEEVWKLLYDPARLPDWLAGVDRVRAVQERARDTRFDLFTAAEPDFPMPQVLRSGGEQGRVVISCLTLEARFEWTLTPVAQGTRIDAELSLPARRADLLEAFAESLAASLERLARLAETECGRR